MSNSVESVRRGLAALDERELRKLATTARVPLAELRRFAAGELDDLRHLQFMAVKTALRKIMVVA
jgi:hypothetical protein